MSGYASFPILDARTGLKLDAPPWRSPGDSFREMLNAYVRRGRIVKRPGYSIFGVLSVASGDETLTGSAGLNLFTDAVQAPVVPPPGGAPYVKDGAGGTHILADTSGRFTDGVLRSTALAVVGEVAWRGGFFGVPNPIYTYTKLIRSQCYVEDAAGVRIYYGDDGYPNGGPFNPDFDNYLTEYGEIAVVIDKAHGGPEWTPPVNLKYKDHIGTLNFNSGAVEMFSEVAPTNDWIVNRAVADTLSLATKPVGGATVETPNMVMKIARYLSRSGTEILVAFDRRRMWSWNGSAFVLAVGSALWNVEPYEKYSLANVARSNGSGGDTMVVITPADPMYYWDGSGAGGWKEVQTDWTAPAAVPHVPDGDQSQPAGYARKIEAGYFVFYIRNRVVVLRVKEGGEWYPTRARWSIAEPNFTSGNSWRINDWSNASTPGAIVDAVQQGDNVIAFMDDGTTWVLESFPDEWREPFRWRPISRRFGGGGPGSMIVGDRVLAIDRAHIVMSDGERVEHADDPIPDEVPSWQLDRFRLLHTGVSQEQELGLIGYPARGHDYTDHALVLQLRDFAWSHFDFPFSAYGDYRHISSPTWDSYTDQWDLLEFPWDAISTRAGHPALMGGDRSLQVFTLFNAADDNGANVDMRLRMQRLNPFAPDRWARLGYVDVIGSSSSLCNLQLRFLDGFSDEVYAERTMNFGVEARSHAEQVRKRVGIFVQRPFHSIELRMTNAEPFAIDAIIFYFKAGRLARRH